MVRYCQVVQLHRGNLANNASGVEAQVQIEGTSFTSSTLSIIRNSDDANDGGIIIEKQDQRPLMVTQLL